MIASFFDRPHLPKELTDRLTAIKASVAQDAQPATGIVALARSSADSVALIDAATPGWQQHEQVKAITTQQRALRR